MSETTPAVEAPAQNPAEGSASDNSAAVQSVAKTESATNANTTDVPESTKSGDKDPTNATADVSKTEESAADKDEKKNDRQNGRQSGDSRGADKLRTQHGYYYQLKEKFETLSLSSKQA